MKLVKYFIVVIFNLILLSCVKENIWYPNTTVYGKCFDKCSGHPLQGKTVQLWGGDDYTSSSYGTRKIYRSVTTDENGYYEIKFCKGPRKYWVRILEDHVLDLSFKFYDLKLLKKGNNEVNFTTINSDPKAFISLHCKNISPINTEDQISIRISEINYKNGYTSSEYFWGTSVDRTTTENIFGCEPLKVSINWTVTKNSITTNLSDSLVCTAGATLSYSINY